MGLDLADFERKARESVMAFWGNREKARQKQIEAGVLDQGERASVTAGKNMDGFVALIKDLVKAGSARNQQGSTGGGNRMQEPGRPFLWKQLQQQGRRSHRHGS